MYGIFHLWFICTEPVLEDEDDDDAIYEDAEEATVNVPQKPDPRVKEIGLSATRVSRNDMLKICGSFNKLKKVAQDQKVPSKNNTMNLLLSNGPGSKSKSSMISSALKSVHKIVDPNEVMDVSANLIMKPDPKPSDTETKDVWAAA